MANLTKTKSMKFSILIIVLFVLTQCRTEKVSRIDLEGNWGCLLNDMDKNLYTELYFHQDTLESFDRMWFLHRMAKYKIENDSLITNNKAFRIEILNKNSVNLINSVDTVHMERISTDEKTIDWYIKNGYFNKDCPDSIFMQAMSSFIDSTFTIRQIEFLIKQGIENRDSLINYWESELKSDSANKTTYEYLIKNINKN